MRMIIKANLDAKANIYIQRNKPKFRPCGPEKQEHLWTIIFDSDSQYRYYMQKKDFSLNIVAQISRERMLYMKKQELP